LVVGRVGRSLVATEARHSLLVVGPSQSGKTSGLVIPALLEWDGPVIATSVKRDLLDATIDRRRALGDVEVFDPTSSAGVPSASWNPLDGAIDWSGAKRVAANLCGVARAGATGLDDASFWYSTTEKLLAPLLFAAANSGLGIADVVRWIDLRLTEEPIARLVELDLPAAWQAAVASFDREDRQLSSVYATAEDVLAAFSDPGVVAVSGSGGIAPQTFFARHAPSIFLVAPARAQERLAPVFVALLGELLDAAFARASSARDGAVRPLLVVLDEAANIAPVRDLDALASTAAGFGIQLVTVFQDTAQIETRYGGRAATVINNHRARVLCSGIADPKTLGEMSTLLGEGEVLAESTSESSGSVTTTWAHERRPLASPDALRRITPGEAVLVYGHLRPVRIRLRPWFSDARLRRLAQRRARRTDGWRWSILGRKETFGEQRVNDPAWTLGTTGAPVVAAGEPGG
jgi:type IV secretion system protein VirD4